MHVEVTFHFFVGCIVAGAGLGIGWHTAAWVCGKLYGRLDR